MEKKELFKRAKKEWKAENKLIKPSVFIAKNLERLGDHATNIADSISYMATGEVKAPSRPKISE